MVVMYGDFLIAYPGNRIFQFIQYLGKHTRLNYHTAMQYGNIMVKHCNGCTVADVNDNAQGI